MSVKTAAAYAVLAAACAVASAPANAATVVQSFDGSGSWNVEKFDPSLGTLNSIIANVTSGFARYNFVLDGNLNAPVSYKATAYVGIYLGPLTIDGSLSGEGFADFVFGEAEILLPLVPYSVNIGVPSDPDSSLYNALIGMGTTLSKLQVDPPFDIVFGDLGDRSIDEVTITARNAGWNLVYDYTPFRGTVPEPTTWAMMLIGFGMVAGATRYRRTSTTVTYHYTDEIAVRKNSDLPLPEEARMSLACPIASAFA
jgi:hypothetical protein